MATKKFTCKVCGYIHEGDAAPATCPVCQAPASEFEEVKAAKKGFLGGTNSNAYIIFYSVVMVVIVAVLLAVASLSLQERQNENMLNEKKDQIVKALGEGGTAYADVVDKAVMIDAEGNVIESKSEADIFAALNDMGGTIAAGTYPLFVAKNGCVVVPVYGAGLWGPVWGYVALEPDMNTVKGIVLDHKGETPGLGAEISTEKHQAMYAGKQIYKDSDLVGITLKKGGTKEGDENYAHEVDAISGGTKTCDGVSAMLKDCLGNYKTYFDGIRAAEQQAAADVTVESNELNNENNE